MKHKSMVLANALAATTAIVFVVCRVLVAIFPDLFFTIAQSWFHGIELERLDIGSLTLSSFVLGLVSSTVTAWLIGYLFAYIQNFFAKLK